MAFLEQMDPEYEPFLFGRNKIQILKLNTKCRMVPTIADLTSSMSHRTVRMHIPTVFSQYLKEPEGSETTPPILYTGLIMELQLAHIQPHIK